MGDALGLESQHRPVDAEPVADTREILLAAELTHEAVVATAATDTRLRAESVVDEFERRLGVVVQSADQAGIDHVRHAELAQMRQHALEVAARVVGQVVEHERCVGGRLADIGALVVEHAQRIDLCALACRLVEVESAEKLLQRLAVCRAAGVVAE